MSLKVVFAGTPEFAVPTLTALLSSSHQVIAVYTQPDRPAGRGRRLMASPVKVYAEACALPVIQPERLDEVALQSIAPDIMVVVAYGLILPPAILAVPPLGCLNLHPSLLPRWRGAAPIQHTLLHGDPVTGVTVIQMEAGLDSGPILLQKEYRVGATENSQALHDRLARVGAELMVETVDALEARRIRTVSQGTEGVTYAPKITKAQALIDWQRPASQIVNQIRAFNPKPVAFTYYGNQRLRIWAAGVVPDQSIEALPGTIVKADQNGILVATGNGLLQLLSIQLPGGGQLTAQEFLNAQGVKVLIGETFFSKSDEDGQ